MKTNQTSTSSAIIAIGTAQTPTNVAKVMGMCSLPNTNVAFVVVVFTLTETAPMAQALMIMAMDAIGTLIIRMDVLQAMPLIMVTLQQANHVVLAMVAKKSIKVTASTR